MCKFPLTGCLQKICNFFCKTCAIRFLMSKAFQKAKYYQNLTTERGSKQRFSLLQEKVVIQAVCLNAQVTFCRETKCKKSVFKKRNMDI